MITQYDKTSYKISKILTNDFSTSFSLGILALDKSIRNHIYSIYGLVRVADEIVDTYHDSDKKTLLNKLKKDTYDAIDAKLSTNPILHSFQLTVNKYNIDKNLIEAFFNSMEMDIYRNNYTREEFKKYVYGSAEVVGLMCLKVFVNGDEKLYKELNNYAKSLGSAFQKVNFLRDIRSDYYDRNRIYLPSEIKENGLTEEKKKELEDETFKDFQNALIGIKKLPKSSKTGVYAAYLYYTYLLKKIKKANLETLLNKRLRISNTKKFLLFIKAFFETKILNYI